MTDDLNCRSCAVNSQPDLPPRERVYMGPHWRVAHAFGAPFPGWLIVLPRRHVMALDELTIPEASDLGPLLREVTHALRQVTGCEKTYVALFAEAEGFGHVHFHVIPRRADLDPRFRGPRVFDLLTGDAAGKVPSGTRDRISASIAAIMPAQL